MKLKIDYTKNNDGWIKVFIMILASDDYETFNIFANEVDYPTADGFKLSKKDNYKIAGIFKTGECAEEWAQEQVVKLKDLLDKWRRIQVPKSKEITI